MYCPYNSKTETQVTQWTEEEDHAGGQQITRIEYELMPCLGAECAAWQGGRCCYAVPASSR